MYIGPCLACAATTPSASPSSKASPIVKRSLYPVPIGHLPSGGQIRPMGSSAPRASETVDLPWSFLSRHKRCHSAEYHTLYGIRRCSIRAAVV
ncbi:hypothetical protein BT67DRAFT_97361 [Trichocladium antarcticum]|uniref:Uncharacterized protein n=1 Tax=Trichocladium antarcticum TaxID=1450529 RepID=A0AAN6UR45_9PEZI|nr:hypothetical protein BT67DRAFT_97361 [Trichocladium antarcticum]